MLEIDKDETATSFTKKAAEYLQTEYMDKPTEVKGFFTIYEDISRRLSHNKRSTISSLIKTLYEISFPDSNSETQNFKILLDMFDLKLSQLGIQVASANEKAFLINPFGPGDSEKCVKLLIETAEALKQIHSQHLAMDDQTEELAAPKRRSTL